MYKSKESNEECIKSLKDVESIDNNSDYSLTTEKMMTSEEAAEYLGISTQSLLNRVSAGSIPYYKLGRLNRYKKSELAHLLLSNKRGKHGD